MIYASLVTLALAVGSATATNPLYTSNEILNREAFRQYLVDFGKGTYGSEEHERRYVHFLNNLKLADARNAAEGPNGARHGITRFSDMSPEEFKAFLSADPNTKSQGLRGAMKEKAPMSEMRSDPRSGDSKDWTGTLTTPVKNQAQCGSCWAFSATEQIESDTMRTLDTTYVLSPQQIVSCDKTAMGCNGGWTEHAYNYVNRAGGIEQNSDYPYTSSTGQSGTCKVDDSKFVVTVDKFYTVQGEDNMSDYVLKTGPLSVCLDASTWSTYKGGIMSACPTQVDHCVQAVGVQTGSGGYWKVRNSWGTSWGEDGFIRLAYGKNTCDITNDPTYTSVAKV
jgi:cathepsin F